MPCTSMKYFEIPTPTSSLKITKEIINDRFTNRKENHAGM
jgi:hypothetical protein